MIAQDPHQGARERDENPPKGEMRFLAWTNGISTVVMAIFTMILARITGQQKVLTDLALNSTRVIERAYVHVAGVRLLPLVVGQPIAARVKVANAGHTPAWVTGSVVKLAITPAEDMPAVVAPASDSDARSTMFLVAGESNTYDVAFQNAELTADLSAAIESEAKAIWILGYVGYRDAFGAHHRVGFGRKWQPRKGMLSYIFGTEFNYSD